MGLTDTHTIYKIDKPLNSTLHSTGSSLQYLVITSNVKESEKEYIYIYICSCIIESLCCILEAHTMLQINCNSIKK